MIIKSYIHTDNQIITTSVADPECARGGSVSHILAEKGLLASLYSKKMHENATFSPIRGGGVRRVRPMLDPPMHIMIIQ